MFGTPRGVLPSGPDGKERPPATPVLSFGEVGPQRHRALTARRRPHGTGRKALGGASRRESSTGGSDSSHVGPDDCAGQTGSVRDPGGRAGRCRRRFRAVRRAGQNECSAHPSAGIPASGRGGRVGRQVGSVVSPDARRLVSGPTPLHYGSRTFRTGGLGRRLVGRAGASFDFPRSMSQFVRPRPPLTAPQWNCRRCPRANGVSTQE
jgi:hypothetical protein